MATATKYFALAALLMRVNSVFYSVAEKPLDSAKRHK